MTRGNPTRYLYNKYNNYKTNLTIIVLLIYKLMIHFKTGKLIITVTSFS